MFRTRTTRRLAIGCFLAACAVAGAEAQTATAPTAPVQPPPLNVTAVLDQYALGNIGTAATFAERPDVGRSVRAFEEHARRWIEADRARIGRRRLIAATFALEVASRWVGGGINWAWGSRLLTWSCIQLRHNPVPEPAERLWHLAAVAVISGADDWHLLTGRTWPKGQAPRLARDPFQQEPLLGHIIHAQARFPSEPRFVMAAAISVDNQNSVVGGYGRDANTRTSLLPGEIDSDYLERVKSGRLLTETGTERTGSWSPRLAELYLAGLPEVRALRTRYAELTRHESVSAEAHLRLAHITLRLADREDALAHLDDVIESTRDPNLAYMAYLLTGVIRDRQGRAAEAVAAYRAALDVVPRAQSATALLSARLFTEGHQAEAIAIVQQFFNGGTAPPDPWRTYRLGDYRLYPLYIAQLRAELR
jgi:Tetratricopeptide repeat